MIPKYRVWTVCTCWQAKHLITETKMPLHTKAGRTNIMRYPHHTRAKTNKCNSNRCRIYFAEKTLLVCILSNICVPYDHAQRTHNRTNIFSTHFFSLIISLFHFFSIKLWRPWICRIFCLIWYLKRYVPYSTVRSYQLVSRYHDQLTMLRLGLLTVPFSLQIRRFCTERRLIS